MKIKNGIILTGGTGTRLAPQTSLTNKHLVLLNKKLVIDYPIENLKSIGVENLYVILGGNHFSHVVDYLKDGEQYGMSITYIYQKTPSGIAQAINLTKPFLDHASNFAVILGDNIYDTQFEFNDSKAKCQVVLANHKELNRFGVASVKDSKIIDIQEKPKQLNPDCKNYAITGCYMFDNSYFDLFKNLQPSARGEYEITDIIDQYNKQGEVDFTIYNGLWSDAGTHESLLFLNNYFYYKNFKDH